MDRNLLKLYSDYLLSAVSYTTVTGLSAITAGIVSHEGSRASVGELTFGGTAWFT